MLVLAAEVLMSRIIVIGAGAIGCAIGGALVQAGNEVTFCARKTFTRLSVQKDGEPPMVHAANVVTTPDKVPAADWVVVCVKAYQVPTAADWLAAAVRPGTRVAVLQNGVEQKDCVVPYVPAGTPIVPVVVDLPVSRTAPGAVHWSRIASVIVPEGPDGAAFVSLFAGSFVTAETTGEFVTRAWLKLCNNAPSGAILALTGQRMRVMKEPGIADLARAILKETVAVGRAEGAHLDDSLIERQVQFFLSAKGDEGNSMYVDRMAGREMEWNARNAVIVRKAALHGIAVPVSTALVPLLAAISNAAKKD
jgi:2-dehydropantoate 2-reductase